MATLTQNTDLRSRLLARTAANPDEVWTPGDFADLGGRAAVDKTLQRLVAAGELPVSTAAFPTGRAGAS